MMMRWLFVFAICACGGKSGEAPTPDAPDDQTPDATCGGESLDLTYVPPSFLIVLDRSCSMDKIPAGATQTKWESAVAALKGLLNNYPTEIDWGLTLFPDRTGDTCGQDAIPIPVAASNATAIKQLLNQALQAGNQYFPSNPCTTNIDTALQQAATDPAIANTAKTRYVMLVTDGAQSACNLGGGDAGSEAAVASLHANGVKTFVVGFGGGVDAVQLDKLAVAGGAPLAGATKYYKADTAGQLQQAFQAIAGNVVSCEYTIDPAPEDIDQTWVWFQNTQQVPRDVTHTDGWDYDPATMKLRFYGSYCNQLETMAVTDVDVIFGCPLPPLF
jgi:hypothetical protein